VKVSTSATQRLAAGDRRRQLLDTALDLFSRKGFEGTTTKEIALAAGVTEAIIFRHFPTKQSLYQAVLDDYHERGGFAECLAEWRAFMDRDDDEGLIRSIIQRILESYQCEEKKHRILFYAALEGHEIGLEHNRQISMPVFELLSQYVERRQKEGALVDCAPGAIIAAVAGMASHYGMMTRLFGFRANLNEQAVVNDFVAIMLNGIRLRKIVKGKK
jgi:TetR/AcrR family transcriptional regulator